MSKGTVRFPASAIVDGRIGTSRIAATIAGAAARLANTAHAELDPSLRAMVAPIASGLGLPVDRVLADILGAPQISVITHGVKTESLTPVQRMQQLGRLPRGKKNKTEAAYELEVLEPQLHAGEILFYRFEAIKLRLADNTFLTVDFPVITAAGELEFREVKGRWTDDARAKIKVAAAQFPWRFYAIHRVGRHGWRIEDLTSRSW